MIKMLVVRLSLSSVNSIQLVVTGWDKRGVNT